MIIKLHFLDRLLFGIIEHDKVSFVSTILFSSFCFFFCLFVCLFCFVLFCFFVCLFVCFLAIKMKDEADML